VLALAGTILVCAKGFLLSESVSTDYWAGTASYAATLSFTSRLMNGKSRVFLPFNGKYLSNLLG